MTFFLGNIEYIYSILRLPGLVRVCLGCPSLGSLRFSRVVATAGHLLNPDRSSHRVDRVAGRARFNNYGLNPSVIPLVKSSEKKSTSSHRCNFWKKLYNPSVIQSVYTDKHTLSVYTGRIVNRYFLSVYTDRIGDKIIFFGKNYRWKNFFGFRRFSKSVKDWNTNGCNYMHQYYFFFFNVSVQASLHTLRLIPHALNLTTM